jgi:transcriptional regulator with XRE-family HTH domain
MTLTEYLATATDPETGKPLTDDAFGKRCGMSQSQISRLRNSKSKPSFEAMEAILSATGGKVTPNDWFEVPAPEAAA